MSAERDALLRQSAAWEHVMDLAHAHMFDGDGALQQDLYDTLRAYAGEERDALTRAVVAEYAAVLARRGAWETPTLLDQAGQSGYLMGARAALRRVADRLGVLDLHAQAAEAVARGAEEEGR